MPLEHEARLTTPLLIPDPRFQAIFLGYFHYVITALIFERNGSGSNDWLMALPATLQLVRRARGVSGNTVSDDNYVLSLIHI